MRELIAKVLSFIPNWLGFVLIIAAGVTSIVVGAIQKSAGLIAGGVAAIASSVLAWVNGATSKPKISVSKKSFGGTVANVDDWVTVVVIVLFVIAIIIGFAVQ